MHKLPKGFSAQTVNPRSDSEVEVDFSINISKQQATCSSSNRDRNRPRRLNLDSVEITNDDTEGSSIIDLRTTSSDVDSGNDCEDGHFKSRRSLSESRSFRSSGNRTPTNKMNFHTSITDITTPETLPDFRDTSIGNIAQTDGFRRNVGLNRSTRAVSSKIERLAKERESLRKKTCPVKESISPDHEVSLIIEKSETNIRKTESSNNKKKSKGGRYRTAVSPTQSFKSTISLLPSSHKKNGLRQQILVTTACSLAPLSCGFAMGFNLIINPYQIIPDHSIPWTWQQHVYLVGAVVGSMLSGFILHFGRRYPLLLTMLSVMFGWLAVIFGTKIWMILFFHGLSGICTSMSLVITQVYVAEIAQPTVRGGLSTAPIMAFHVGLLLCFTSGEVISSTNISLVGLLLMAPFFVFFVMCLPESPRHLARSHSSDTLAVLQWLRGFSRDVMDEFKEIVDNNTYQKSKDGKSGYGSPSFWRPLMVTCTLMFLYNMSGASSIAFYARELLGKGSNTYVDASYFILTGTVLVGMIFASFLMDQVGRKLLLLLAFTIMSATAFALGLFLFLKDMHKVQTYFIHQWAAETFCVILFTLAHGAAVAPIAWITLGEAFPPHTKWLGVMISSSVFWLSMLGMDIIYHQISFIIATGGLFWFHCIICVGGYIFLLLNFRELKDHNIDEVARVYEKKSESLIDTFLTRI